MNYKKYHHIMPMLFDVDRNKVYLKVVGIVLIMFYVISEHFSCT